MTPADEKRRLEIDTVCPGWSSALHWQFFEKVLQTITIKRMAILGVYHGRDIAYLRSIRPDLHLVGVDLFSNTEMADWPETARGLTWEEAGFGKAPTPDQLQANLEKLGVWQQDLAPLTIVRGDAETFLKKCGRPVDRDHFDLIYIDTSHDYETTRATIAAAVATGCPLIAGDDFADGPDWGVASAVKEAFTEYQVFGNWIWIAEARHFKHPGDST